MPTLPAGVAGSKADSTSAKGSGAVGDDAVEASECGAGAVAGFLANSQGRLKGDEGAKSAKEEKERKDEGRSFS
jgi:hypothetical protein